METLKPLKNSLLILVAISCCATGRSYAQENKLSKSLPHSENKKSAEFNIIRTIPKRFNMIDTSRMFIVGDVWQKEAKDSAWEKFYSSQFGILGPVLQSDDKQCEIYYDYMPFFVYESPAYDGDSERKNSSHRNFIKRELISRQEGRDDFLLEDYVTVISDKQAKKRFNADSIFIYNIPIDPIEQDGEIYEYYTHMYIARNNRVLISIGWFFTDDGEKRKQHYINKLDKHIWYKD